VTPIDWRRYSAIPSWWSALLESLRFSSAAPESLGALDRALWTRLLDQCDQQQLTLSLVPALEATLPEWVRARLVENLTSNRERVRRLWDAYGEIAACFERAGIEYLVLRGFTHSPDFAPLVDHRVQYDIDLFFPSQALHRARDTLLGLDYASMISREDATIDHLPAMVRKTGWQWRGDFYDPDLPASIELHFLFWNRDVERIEAPGVEAFWERRIVRHLDGRRFPALAPVDALGYSALHNLRRLLRARVRLVRVYELAYFLHTRADDDGFWNSWLGAHAEGLRRLEAIAFRLAAAWFDCRLHPLVREEVERLPAGVTDWFARYAAAPVENLFQPNKHELWLHLALLDSARDRRSVLGRRLFPMRPPGPVDAVHIPEERMNLRRRALRTARYLLYAGSRAWRHLRVLPGVLAHGSLWWWRGHMPGRDFWRFLAAASLFSLGMFVFVILYNLFLLDLGFREDFLGFLNAASTAGSIAGSLPAGLLLARLGLRRTVLACFASTALLCGLRAWLTAPVPLVLLAFLGGTAFSVWAVAIGPAIASLTSAAQRARGFSVFMATSIGLGVPGGFLAGRLPAWLARTRLFPARTDSKQAALLSGAALVALASSPAARLPRGGASAESRGAFPFTPFVRRFLPAVAFWNLATGAFNPFFNAYFASHLGAGVERIGSVFAAAQVAQVAAMLVSPWLLRSLGLVRGIMTMQLATAAALAALAGASSPGAASLAYCGYMAFQWMSGPGIYTLLMNGIREEQRGGASALHSLAGFSTQAIASAVSGVVIARWGYQKLLAAACGVAVAAGLLFRALLGRFENPGGAPDER